MKSKGAEKEERKRENSAVKFFRDFLCYSDEASGFCCSDEH